MSIRTLLGLVATVVAGLVLALAVPALPAIGQQSPPMSPPDSVPASGQVVLFDTGRVQARGALAFVDVEVFCDGADEGEVFVTLTQRRLLKVTEGSGRATVDCGEPTVVEVAVTPFGGLGPFRAGYAFAEAQFAACPSGYGPCAVAEDQRVVRLRR